MISKKETNEIWTMKKKKKIHHFLCILESGELYLKGDRGCLAAESRSKSIFFSIGLLNLGLDFRLFVCEKGMRVKIKVILTV